MVLDEFTIDVNASRWPSIIGWLKLSVVNCWIIRVNEWGGKWNVRVDRISSRELSSLGKPYCPIKCNTLGCGEGYMSVSHIVLTLPESLPSMSFWLAYDWHPFSFFLGLTVLHLWFWGNTKEGCPSTSLTLNYPSAGEGSWLLTGEECFLAASVSVSWEVLKFFNKLWRVISSW